MLVEEGNNKNIEHVAPRYFNTAEGYEKSLDKDLSNFSIAEIIGLYKYVCTYSLEVLMQLNSLYKRYTYYCKDIGFVEDGINHYEEVTNEIMLNCTTNRKNNGSIISRDDLIKEINGFPNPSDSFLLLAIFEGLAGTGMSDLVDIKLSQFKGNIVHLASGRELTVSKELLHFAQESAITFDYHYKDAKNLYYIDDNESIILKELCNVRESRKTLDRKNINLVRKLARLRNRNEHNAFTYGHLVESGRINMIQNFMREDNETDVRRCMSNHRNEITTRYGRIVSYNRYLLKYSEFFE